MQFPQNPDIQTFISLEDWKKLPQQFFFESKETLDFPLASLVLPKTHKKTPRAQPNYSVMPFLTTPIAWQAERSSTKLSKHLKAQITETENKEIYLIKNPMCKSKKAILAELG